MLFRDNEGKLVEINRLNYKTDAIYYKKIESIRMGMGGNQMGGNQMGGNQMCGNQMGGNQMGGNQMGEKRNPKVAGGGSIERIMSLVEKCKTEN